jgi:hypothetical protein
MRDVVAVIGELICQGRIPLTQDELAEKVRARSHAAAARVGEVRIEELELVGPSGSPRRESYVSRPPSAAPRSEPSSPKSSTSGVMPAVGHRSQKPPAPSSSEPPPAAPRTLWGRAALASAGMPLARAGQTFSPPLRDSTAAILLTLLLAADPTATDRLELLEGRSLTPILPQLRREACACLTAALFKALVAASFSRAAAAELAEAACREALAPDPMPASEVQRYVGSAAPVRDLAHRAAAILGAPQDAGRLFAAVSAYAASLRPELVGAAATLKPPAAE